MRSTGHSDDTVTFDKVKAKHVSDTGKALLCLIREHGEVWVPLSVIDDDSDVYGRGDEGTLVVRGWWARKEGLA